MSLCNKINRVLLNMYMRAKLKNKSPSIICCNCIGGVMLHDLGLEFKTPTINLFFAAEDYIRYVENMEYYNALELEFCPDIQLNYPVAKCGDIKINFMHYASIAEAEGKWYQRVRKIDYDNLFFIFTDMAEGCTYEHLKRFDNLKCKNKVVFTALPYDEIQSSFYIPGFEEQGHVGNLIPYRNCVTGKRFYDYFNYVKWLNEDK